MIVAVIQWPGFFDKIGRVGGHAPFVAIGADFAFDIKIIQQHKLTRQLVVVGRGPLGKQAELRIAIALRKIAQHLIVSSVLFDDVKTVLERACLARLQWNGIAGWRRRADAKISPQRAALICLRCVGL